MFYLTQAVHRNAQIRKDKIATINGNRQRNWAELKERVARFASGLHSLGVDTGDRVAILSLNSDRYFEYYFGVPWAGACVVPLNIRWSLKENAYSLKDAGVNILLVDDAFAEMALALLLEDLELEHIIYIGDKNTPEGMVNYEDLISNNEVVEDAYRSNDDLAGIFYTGGTTGFPKGVMLTHTNLWSSAICLLNSINLKEYARILHTAPMFHIADGAMTHAGMLAGSTHVFIPMFTPLGTIEAMDNQKITHTLMVPIMIQMTVNEPAVKSADLSHLEFVIYGASPISESVLVRAMDTFSNAKFCQGYGQTELSPLATLLTHEYHVIEGPNSGKLKSAGKAVTCTEVRIADVDGKEVATGIIGEIIVKGSNAMAGYWNKPEETATSLRNGWVHTGDAGFMDEDGFVFLVDRVKDMIVSGGENVYSAETENAVMNHPAVQEVVVIGIPSDKWGEQVHAEVILKEGHTATEAEIISKASEYIANYKCPRSIKFRTEPFPLSGAGKLLKKDVRKVYWEGKDRQIN
ncbi:class I adenylate-forming enzyme family protein [Maribacter halichondriae]|uniref:class I adenylate-forming enzyme family protein n=1 Tax=Maribacter halichondriae TaxID=2980554 RepID=UPI00235930CE|nr:long-chain-fatty-acid--CoA ligase [Maribacter sp. Hal144]